MVTQEDALKNSARRMLRKDTIGPLALPSVLTVGMMLIFFCLKKRHAFKKEQYTEHIRREILVIGVGGILQYLLLHMLNVLFTKKLM
jgi:hypothetical protein